MMTSVLVPALVFFSSFVPFLYYHKLAGHFFLLAPKIETGTGLKESDFDKGHFFVKQF